MTYKVTQEWSGGFQADVTVTNTSDTSWNGWQLGWSFPDGQKVTQMWNATPQQEGAKVTATDVAWNGNVAAGSSVGFGFTGSSSVSNGKPTAFTVGGDAYSLG